MQIAIKACDSFNFLSPALYMAPIAQGDVKYVRVDMKKHQNNPMWDRQYEEL